MARCLFAGFRKAGEATRSDENGSGSTPRKGAGLMATDADASPRPARISVKSPPKECPITTGFFDRPLITWSKCSATSPTDLPAKTSGCAFPSSTVSGSSG